MKFSSTDSYIAPANLSAAVNAAFMLERPLLIKGETMTTKHRPVILITSNNEKELPDAFLRRCLFHYIRFPEPETLARIIKVHFPDLKEQLLTTALTQFHNLRDTLGLEKKPSTSEILAWIKLLLAEDMSADDLESRVQALPKLHGALLKDEQDITLIENASKRSSGYY